jgi:hypothetical protein
MFESLRRKFGSERSEFLGRVDKDGGWALNVEVAVEALRRGVEMGGPMLILGTAFSYVHLLDYLTDLGISFNLPAGTRVMETGGYKGRSRSLPKDQLHQLICERLGILRTDVICEYGMSELSSQAYDQPPIDPPSASRSSRCEENPNSKSEPHEADERKFHRGDNESGIGLPHSTTLARNSGIFHFPPWARAQIISPETGREVNDGETGLIRVFDLANVSSVMAIQTEDLGVRRGDGFELVGRASLAEARGCSLMAV